MRAKSFGYANVYVMPDGIAGWVKVTRKPALNADPALDFGYRVPALRSCLAVPVLSGDTVAGVLALYRGQPQAFSESHARLLELLAPRIGASLDAAVLADQQSAQPVAAPSLTLVKTRA